MIFLSQGEMTEPVDPRFPLSFSTKVDRALGAVREQSAVVRQEYADAWSNERQAKADYDRAKRALDHPITSQHPWSRYQALRRLPKTEKALEAARLRLKAAEDAYRAMRRLDRVQSEDPPAAAPGEEGASDPQGEGDDGQEESGGEQEPGEGPNARAGAGTTDLPGAPDQPTHNPPGRPAQEPLRPDHDREPAAPPAEPVVGQPVPDPTAPEPQVDPVDPASAPAPGQPAPVPPPERVPYSPPPIVWTPPGVDNVPERICCGPPDAP